MTDRDFVKPASRTGLVLTIGLAIAWPALWLLWPKLPVKASLPDGTEPGRPVKFVFRAMPGDRLLASPTLIALPSAHGFTGELKALAADNTALSVVRSNPEVLLSRTDHAASINGKNAAPLIDTSPDTSVSRYIPRGTLTPVFAGPGEEPDGSVSMEVSADLQKYGFRSTDTDSIKWPEAEPWVVEAIVEIDESGQVKHVLVDQPAAQEPVNDAVVRLLYRGRLETQGKPCSGRVTVSRN